MKKLIDSKGKVFGKINIIDLGIIIAVAVLVCMTIIKFDKADRYMTSDKTIEYTVKIKGIRQVSVDALEAELEGIKEYDTKKELGDITDIKVTPSKELVRLADGTYTTVELDDLYDAFLTLQVKGTETEDNYYTATGKKLIVGETITMNNDHVTSNGVVKSVKVK